MGVPCNCCGPPDCVGAKTRNGENVLAVGCAVGSLDGVRVGALVVGTGVGGLLVGKKVGADFTLDGG